MHLCNARTTAVGMSMYALYFGRQRTACDMILAVLGAYAFWGPKVQPLPLMLQLQTKSR